MAETNQCEIWFLLLLQMQKEKMIWYDCRQKDNKCFKNMFSLIVVEKINSPSLF